MSEADPRIQAFLRGRDKDAPVGVRCVVSPLAHGRFYVEPEQPSQLQSLVVQNGEYIGFVPFTVARNTQGRDVVTVPPGEVGAISPDQFPVWLPSFQLTMGFSFTGTPLNLTLTAGLNLLDVGLVPRVPGINYVWDETTTFSASIVLTNALPDSHTWGVTAPADNSYNEDPSPWSFEWADDNDITTVQVSLFGPTSGDPVLLQRVLFSYQFALTGSDPISMVTEYQLANSTFGF